MVFSTYSKLVTTAADNVSPANVDGKPHQYWSVILDHCLNNYELDNFKETVHSSADEIVLLS
jgi:hypothetical protein